MIVNIDRTKSRWNNCQSRNVPPQTTRVKRRRAQRRSRCWHRTRRWRRVTLSCPTNMCRATKLSIVWLMYAAPFCCFLFVHFCCCCCCCCCCFQQALHVRAVKRQKFSRHRPEHPDADIDYINNRNKEFNKKICKLKKKKKKCFPVFLNNFFALFFSLSFFHYSTSFWSIYYWN